MTIRVRALTGADAVEVSALADRLTVGVAPWRDAERVRVAVRGWLRDSTGPSFEGVSFVAEDATGVVGYVSVSTVEHFAGELDAYVGELVVAGRVEGGGVGSRLLEAAEQWAAAQGLRCVTLTTGAANDRALAFYAARGYRAEDVKLTKTLG